MEEEIGLDFLLDQQYPQIEPRAWMKDCVFVRVSASNIAACIDHCINAPQGHFALDLETTGLDNRVFDGKTVDQIVGVCLCPDGKTGYYIPLRHREGANVPWTLFEKEFRRLMEAVDSGKVVADFHGGIFDQEFLNFWGGEPFGDWDKPSSWDDTEILVYLENPRRRDKRLKHLSREELGCDQIELKELFPEDYKGPLDFSTLDPDREEVIWYGGGDGIFTYRLREKYWPLIMTPADGRSQKTIYQIEKSCVASVRWMHRNRIYVDRKKVLELVKLGQKEWLASILDLYAAVSQQLGRDVMPGYYKFLAEIFDPEDPDNLLDEQIQRARSQYQRKYVDPKEPVEKGGKSWDPVYDVCSPQQLGNMFWELEVPGLVFTEKSGQVKTSADVLDDIVERAGSIYPFMGKVKRFREISKAMSNYLFPMLTNSEPTDNTIRINFRAHKLDTGRFATPSKEGGDLSSKKSGDQMTGWPQMNLQSMPATYDPDRPECMRRLRECVAARQPLARAPWANPAFVEQVDPQKRYIAAIDFSGVELRLATNLSREPKWLSEFFHCSSCDRRFDPGDGNETPDAPPPRCPNCGSDKIGDLHTLTALSIFGSDSMSKPDWKHLRQKGKTTNFALLYGGGGNAVIRATGCDKNEGWRIKRVFDETYKVLCSWWNSQWSFARKNLYVMTGFGRKYPLPDINHVDGGFRSKAERNAANGPVQGTSADITKLAMALIYKECKKRGWVESGKVMMIITMHDELVFDISADVLEEAIEVFKPIMCRNPLILSRKWPIPLTSDVEIGYDWSVQWDLNAMRVGEVRFQGNKKFKAPAKAEEAGLVWDDLSKFPEELDPWFKWRTLEDVNAWLKDPEYKPEAQRPTQEKEREEPSLREDTHPGPPKGLKKGDTYVFKLQNLGYETIGALATVIHQCQGHGTRNLKIELPNGTMLNDLDPWKETYPVDMLVNENEFFYLAKANGLC